MANMKNISEERKCIEKGFSTFERNNYFCGKLMVERDFWAEQLYHIGKLRLHNAYLHGWGVVCGLKVDPHPNCPNLRVLIRPGLAIDCCGREILVPKDCEVELESYKKNGNNNNEKPENLYICLSYKECETEPVPVFLDDCGCTETCKPNRIQEIFEIKVLTKNDFEENELKEYLHNQVISTDKVNIIPTTTLDKFDGTITIKTQSGTFEANITANYSGTDEVNKLLNDINNSTAQVKINHIPDKEKYVITANNRGDVIILEEKGIKPFFSAINIPAFQTDKGNKIIEACPDCMSNPRIILAEIQNYKNVDDTSKHYLDSSSNDFKTPAYMIDNFSYRKTLPSIELINKLTNYLMFKK